MRYWQRLVIGYSLCVTAGILVVGVYRLTHINAWLLTVLTGVTLVVLLAPWMAEGEWIWNLKRKSDESS